MSNSSPQISLDVQNVSVAYVTENVIEDISIAVKPGEIFGLIGLNGAGKTTLIKTILGLRQQNSGEVQIFGQSVSDKESRKQLAYLPERFDPPWFLSGMEFVKFSLRMYGKPFNKDEVIEAAENLALDPAALKRRVQTYSKGMRQKLGLIATILTGCHLLILDEPMSGLDPMARTLVKDMIMQKKGREQTVFLCSHILADMDEICDRVAVLHSGRIQFTGTPEELRRKTGVENLERAFLHFIDQDQIVKGAAA